MREIIKEELISNINTIINSLEFDSMRSGGKCKINAGTIVDLYNLRNLYIAEQNTAAAVKKPAAKK